MRSFCVQVSSVDAWWGEGGGGGGSLVFRRTNGKGCTKGMHKGLISYATLVYQRQRFEYSWFDTRYHLVMYRGMCKCRLIYETY